MKLTSFEYQNRRSWGVVAENSVIDLGAELGQDLKHWLTPEGLREVAQCTARRGADCALEDVKLHLPIPNPEKIVCIGVNYANRNAEYRDDSMLPKYPSVFIRYPDSFAAHGEPMLRPPESDKLDYEGEIAIVIGAPGRRIPEADAERHIAGLTLLNDGTLRDWVRHAKFNVTQGKNFHHSGAIGPWMVSADEIPGYDDLHLETRVNGEVRQRDTTANLMFPFRYLVSYLSSFMTLRSGDVIATGTPNGAGARLDPPQYLAPGDVVEVESPAIGVLCNRVEDETG